jgi:hypothetical protein
VASVELDSLLALQTKGERQNLIALESRARTTTTRGGHVKREWNDQEKVYSVATRLRNALARATSHSFVKRRYLSSNFVRKKIIILSAARRKLGCCFVCARNIFLESRVGKKVVQSVARGNLVQIRSC